MNVRRYIPAPDLAMWCDEQGHPQRCVWHRRGRWVLRVERTWEVVTADWLGADEILHRRYYDLAMRDGLRCVVYRDHLTGTWHLESAHT